MSVAVNAETKPWCCIPECSNDATVQIWDDEPGAGPDSYTHACDDHVGALLFEGRNRVGPLGWEV